MAWAFMAAFQAVSDPGSRKVTTVPYESELFITGPLLSIVNYLALM
jgi:hypothetical protein